MIKEHDLQVIMVKWFRLIYPRLEKNIFAVPNGGQRIKSHAVKLKKEGVTAGVSDLIFCLRGNVYFIEVKTEKGKQSKDQKKFEEMILNEDLKYFVVRSLNEFIKLIRNIMLQR